jgi:hypothetical protein
MKHSKICCLLALSIILALLAPLSPVPTHAASGALSLYPFKGEIGDFIKIDGWGFEAGKQVNLYFSSNKADVGDKIDKEVTAYKDLGWTYAGPDCRFISPCYFNLPEALTDGRHEEDVHGGDYYVYAIYINISPPSSEIVAAAKFTVIDGEIELDPEEGTVGSEVEISGEGLRKNQKITVEYESDEVDIIGGDSETDSEGQFVCTIIIPESAIGDHIITVIDESGNKPEAEFGVKPKITLDPSQQSVGEVVEVSGTGFTKREIITLTLDERRINTIPDYIETSYKGSFNCSFIVPFVDSCGVRKVEASAKGFSRAGAQLTVLAGIWLSLATASLTSPGHVGMELIVRGVGFIADAKVTITYSEDDGVSTVATTTTDADGNFKASFIVPPSVAGSHVITATDGATSGTSTFTMESQAPPVLVPLLPKVAGTVAAEAHFDWEEVTDPSGVSYTLQVASDADFTAIVLEKEGLPHSEYTLTEEEKLEPTGKKAYYWRAKAVDGAFNEGGWSPPVLFYVGSAWTSMPGWVWYIFYGLGALLLAILGFRLRKRFTQ